MAKFRPISIRCKDCAKIAICDTVLPNINEYFLCSDYEECEIITVKYNDMKYTKLKTDDLKAAYNNGCTDVKKVLKNLYPDVIFVRKLPKTWEEFCELTGYPIYGCHVYFMNITMERLHGTSYVTETSVNTTPNSKYTALRKLELLRDYYNDGWKPKEIYINHTHYCIERRYNSPSISNWAGETNINRFLYFKTPELRDEFYNNFKDLIKEAEDLI